MASAKRKTGRGPAGGTDPARAVKRRWGLLLYLMDVGEAGATYDDIKNAVPDYLSVSDKTFRRDRAQLARCGYEIEETVNRNSASGPRKRFRFDVRKSYQDQMKLSPREFSLLKAATGDALADPNFYMHDELRRAAEKLPLGLPEEEGPGDGGDAVEDETHDGSVETMRKIVRTVKSAWGPDRKPRSRVRFVYRKDGETAGAERNAVPLKFYTYLGSLYLLAYDLDAGSSRHFKIDRIDAEAGIEVVPADGEVLAEASAFADDQTRFHPFQIAGNRKREANEESGGRGEEDAAGGSVESDGCGEEDAAGGSVQSGGGGADSASPEPDDGFVSGTRFEAVLYISGYAYEDARHWASSCKGSVLEPCGNGLLWKVWAADEFRLAQWAIENGPGILVVEPEGVSAKMRWLLERMADGDTRRDVCDGAGGGEI